VFGYVRPVLGELTEEDRGRFQAAYCGLCHTLGTRYGMFARFLLNYDFTFLAILLLEQGEGEREPFHCPCKGPKAQERLQSSAALETAADETVILSYWKLRDEVADSGFFRAMLFRFLCLLLRPAYRRAAKERTGFDKTVQEQLANLQKLERERCPSIDRPADAFARLLSAAAEDFGSEEARRVHRQMLYQLGRWIYLVDALDDLKEDAEKGRYNPLIYRFHAEGGTLDEESRRRLLTTLEHSINLIASAFALSDHGAWNGVVEHIIYRALPLTTRAVSEGTWRKAPRFARRPFRNVSKEMEPTG
jgi:hypothetical protein